MDHRMWDRRVRGVLVLVAMIAPATWAQSPSTQEEGGRSGSEQREPAKKKVRPKAAGENAEKQPAAPRTTRPRPEPEKNPVKDVQSELERGGAPESATVERIMDQAVRNIAARYSLNQAQTEETHKLMRREVLRFIQEHESEVWPLVRDLLASGIGTRPPESKEEVSRIGKAGRPIARLAKEAIFRANEEWGLILNAEQKKTHDFDMAEMRTTFEKLDTNLAEWEEGRVPPGGLFPQPQLADRQPPRPRKPPEGLPEPEIEVFNPANVFEALVERFIKDYEPDEAQITSARSILGEFIDKANDFRQAKKDEFAKNAAEQQEAARQRDLAAIKRTAADHKKLLEPVYDLVDQMEDRLHGLLTTAQIQRYEDKQKGAKEARTVKEAKRTEPAAPPNDEPSPPKTDAAPAKKPGTNGGAAKSDSRE